MHDKIDEFVGGFVFMFCLISYIQKYCDIVKVKENYSANWMKMNIQTYTRIFSI